MTSRQATSEYARKAGSAVRKVTAAVKSGRMVRPATCSECGGTAKIEGHHHNGYESDHALDVVWLCRSCHLARHRKRVVPPWERRVRAYMLATRGPTDYGHVRTFTFSTLTTPKYLLAMAANLWDLLRTDQERAAMVGLIGELAKGREDGAA